MATAIVGEFGHPFDDRVVHDLRVAPHSGYRAVHLWLRVHGARVEVQIRTHLQSVWANAYEAAADALGREIRYGVIPEEELARKAVLGLQNLSTRRVAEVEQGRNDVERIEMQLARAHLPGASPYAAPAELTDRSSRLRDSVRERERNLMEELPGIGDLFRGPDEQT